MKLIAANDPLMRTAFIPGMVQPLELDERVERMLRSSGKSGLFAHIEVQGLGAAERGQSGDAAYQAILRLLGVTLGPDDVFCWNGQRFTLLFADSAAAARTLRHLSRRIGKLVSLASELNGLLTPTIGSVELRMASDISDLRAKAESALGYSRSTLDLEPFHYNPKLERAAAAPSKASFSALWNKVPNWLGLTIQFIISCIVGLGIPFVIYAVCDALGSDISGTVYIGVVSVLVATAVMILIEALLALNATKCPAEAASPYPPATVIIPAYLPNEAATIVETLNAFLRLDYPNVVQVIVAYNTPKSMPVEEELRAIAAANVRTDRFIIEPVRVMGSTSKAQNVNSVIGQVRGEFVGIYDADHHPQPESLRRAWRWLSNGWSIVQGRCSIRNGEDSWVARMVTIEFEQIYALNHPGRARFHGFGIFGGSNGFWRTSVLHETRMRHAMLTEDIDSSIRAVHAGYRIASDRDLISKELAPTKLDQLLSQRLRWAQGWLQVSYRRIVPALFSRDVSWRQKFGLIHLLVWRELFPWYSIQVLPILAYWVWAYGWGYINWTIPVFLATTFFTVATVPTQIVLTHRFAEKSIRKKTAWFVEYFFVSMFFYTPFKDLISRISHVKEAMGEKAWRVTPRAAPARQVPQLATMALIAVLGTMLMLPATPSQAQTAADPDKGFLSQAQVLIGGAVTKINDARRAVKEGRHEYAAGLFREVIDAVPNRRFEFLPEYADALNYSSHSAEAAVLYRELLASSALPAAQRPDISARLALALTWSKQLPEALAIYDGLQAAAPADADIALNRAQILGWLGRHDDAVAALDRIAAARWSSGKAGAIGDEILVGAARNAARTDKNKLAAQLFDRAIKHNSALRSELLREFADQLTYSDQARDAVPLYRDVLSNSSREDQFYKDTLRGLALALEWSRNPAESLKAWTAYLKLAPRDTDAIIHTGQILAALGQNDKALEAFRQALAIDGQNATARRGVVDQSLNLARVAVRNNRRAEALPLLDEAVRVDNRVRKDLLLEYADQLSFDGQAEKAIAHYREVLAGSAPSEADRARATAGMANAFTWSGRLNEGATQYVDLVAKFPEDVKLQATGVLLTARQAAKESQNKEAAALFAQAIKLGGITDGGILREYADQLSFSGRAEEAIPVYLKVLGQATLNKADRVSARKGLAQAYVWSSRPDEADSMYQELLKDHPEDVSLQWDYLVLRARVAATADRNDESAGLFVKAMELNSERRGEILREYADQLTYLGRSKDAIPLYLDYLKQKSLEEMDVIQAKKGLALAYEWTGLVKEAKAVYGELVEKQSDDPTLQWKLLVASARDAARNDRNSEAADLFAKAIAVRPEHSNSIMREYADQLGFAGRSREAVPVYLKVLAQPGLEEADLWTAKRSLAQAYSWSGQPVKAKPVYQELIEKFPDDVLLKWDLVVLAARAAAGSDKNRDSAELFGQAISLVPVRRQLILKEYADQLLYSDSGKVAIPLYRELLASGDEQSDMRGYRLSLALALTWTEQLEAGLAEYQQLLALNPADVDAQNGAARTLSWMGRHSAAKSGYSKVLDRNPGNAEAQRGLAQVESWLGHHRSAQEILNKRLKADPNDVEARKLLIQSLIWMGRPDRAKAELARLSAGERAAFEADSEHAGSNKPRNPPPEEGEEPLPAAGSSRVLSQL